MSFRHKDICFIRKITGTQINLCKENPKENPEQKCYIIKTRSEKHNMKEILYESDLLKAAKKKQCLQNAQDAKRNETPNSLEKLLQKVKEMLKFQLLEKQFSEKYKIILKKQDFVQQQIQNRLNSIIFKQELNSKPEKEDKTFIKYHHQLGEMQKFLEKPKTIPELALKNWELISNFYQKRVLQLKTTNWKLIRLSYQNEAIRMASRNWDIFKIYYQQNISKSASKSWEIVKTTSKNKIVETSAISMEIMKISIKNTPDMAAKGWDAMRKSYYFRYMKQVPFMMIEYSKIALIYVDAYYQIFMQSQFKAEMIKIIILTFDASKKATIKILIVMREAINAYIEKNPPKNLLKKK